MNGQAQRLEGASYDQVHPLVSECCGRVIRSVSQLGLGLVSQTHTGQWSSWSKLTSGLGTGNAVVEHDWLHSLGLVLLRVRFSGSKLLKQVQLVSSPGVALVDRTATCPLQTIRSLRRLG